MRDIAVVDADRREDQAGSGAVDQPFMGCHFVCHGARVDHVSSFPMVHARLKSSLILPGTNYVLSRQRAMSV